MSPVVTSLRCALVGAMAVLVAGMAIPRAAQAEPTARVGLAVARQAVLHRHVVGYGTVSPDPNYVTTLALPREGIIAAVAVRAGQIVKVGDPIATVETAPAAAATYQQAELAVAFAAQDLAHTKALYGQQLATRSQLASAEKAYADAKAQLAGREQDWRRPTHARSCAPPRPG